MISYRRPYVESSVFIAFIRGEVRDGGHDCKRIFQAILDAATQGNILIYTSSLTIAEVCKKKQFPELLSNEIVDLRPYFRDPCIRIVEVDREIGEEASLLCQSSLAQAHQTPKLRPNDAIHLACAERAGCDYLLSYDQHLTGQERDGLIIEWPREFPSEKRNITRGREYEQPGLPFSEPQKLLQAPASTETEVEDGSD